MGKQKITWPQLEAEVRRLATERPWNKYGQDGSGRCAYAAGVCSDGSIGCIFGQALRACGVNPIEFDSGSEQGQPMDIAGVLEELGLVSGLTRKVMWANEVQGLQDAGEPWGNALAQADECYQLPTEAP